jgi:hypothetical protein
VSESSQKQPSQASTDWDNVEVVPLPEDHPIFQGVLIYLPSVPTNSTPPSVPTPNHPEATPSEEDGRP